ncbi:hypothetical protein CPJCM30710_10420 [Clostridium polyendosporum]|uniref:Uncharacterized protein n=1 Tax=Clostridium polyendosporum TaxID=69208 RepID=A0A919RZ44_9CLOT|nr:hypothetical protein [Clostridium polyendosporum]GIM28376.1 hypothetical protein CPJCM30710_10420 [Clostridium polyendosporum]
MLEDVLAISEHYLNNDQALRTIIKERNIGVVGNAKVTKITPNGISYAKDGQEHILHIIAAGYRSNNQLEYALDGKAEYLTVIGNEEVPRKILTAVHEGYHTIRVM